MLILIHSDPHKRQVTEERCLINYYLISDLKSLIEDEDQDVQIIMNGM